MCQIEQENQELLKKVDEVQVVCANALAEAKRGRAVVESANARANDAEKRWQDEARARRDAELQTEVVKRNAKTLKNRYKVFFIGVSILTITLAVMNAYSHRSVLTECGQWFVDRGRGLLSLTIWGSSLFTGLAGYFTKRVPIEALGYVIAGVVFIAGIAGIGYVVCSLYCVLVKLFKKVRKEYKDSTYKIIVTVSIAVSLFYVCLFFYEPIKSVVSFNILSVWLLLSLIGAIVVNLQEIIVGFASSL